MPEEWIRRNETEIDLFIPAEIISAEIVLRLLKRSNRLNKFYPVTNKSSITSSVLVAVKPG
ncbi:hypothetical protein, partial [Acinetobacter baumannii]|uniref:hypothetical protein n=1 Tax=Acinetobacter baumannii TaxID=470 RepID=UPI001BC88726